VYDIQAQSMQATPTAFASFALAAAAQAHGVNPSLVVLAGVTTDRPEDTAANMFASASAVLGMAPPNDIVGFWLNSQSGVAAEITMSVDFLTMLQGAGY